MDVVNERCAGLDVHKRSVVACRIVPDGQGGWRKEIQSFGTMTQDLLALADWLRAGQVKVAAMESTGVYWKPVYNILEAEFELLLVNAKHIKFVPGRKTDVKDAQWIAELLQCGLLKASFIPELEQRDLRDLVRYRSHLIQERTREVNRVHKVLEDANLKLSNVASDILGVSGREMLQAIVAGSEDPAALAQLAHGRLRQKIEELERALTGHIRTHHRLMLRLHLEHIDDLNSKIVDLEQEIERQMPPFEQAEMRDWLDEIPGVGLHTIQVVVAEMGLDLARFPTHAHLVSWAGLAPGKQESAGRNYSAKTSKANRYLRTALVEAAHAAGRTNSYLGAMYKRLSRRRGKKRAAVAVARKLLIIIYHMLREGTPYIERGADYFDQRQHQSTTRWLTRRLEKLGYVVNLEPVPTAA